MVKLLKKDRARYVMEAACQRTVDSLRFFRPRIPHSVAVMVVALAFHTEDPYGVGDALNILSPPTSTPRQGRRQCSSCKSGT